MNNNQKKTALAAVVAGALGFAFHKKHQQVIVDRFPEIDPKIVRKAYNRHLKNAFSGRYEHLNIDDNAVMDELFLKEVAKLISQ